MVNEVLVVALGSFHLGSHVGLDDLCSRVSTTACKVEEEAVDADEEEGHEEAGYPSSQHSPATEEYWWT